MEEEGILLMGSLYRQQVEVEERKVEKEEDEEMDNADSAAYPREVLDMLASLYNASRRNDGVEKEEGKVVRNSRKLNREENLAIWEEENDEEEDDEEEVEVLEDMLGQMYNTSQGMTKALFRVVEEGRVERKKEEEMVEMCFEEEERVYQVIYLCFIEYPFSLFSFILIVMSHFNQVALVAIAHIAVWPEAQAFLEASKPNCVHCLYRSMLILLLQHKHKHNQTVFTVIQANVNTANNTNNDIYIFMFLTRADRLLGRD